MSTVKTGAADAAKTQTRRFGVAARLALLACVVGLGACGEPASEVGAAAAEPEYSLASIPAGSYAAAWGPELGGKVPLLAANDHAGSSRDLTSLAGDNGLLLIFSRSTVW